VNPFIKVGTYLKLSGFTAISGPNVNGVVVVITSCPAIGTNTGGNYQATIPIPLPTTGNGSAGTLNRFSIATPDLRLAGPVGAQTGTINLGTSGGASTVVISADNLPQHRHGYNLAAGTGYLSADGNNGNRAAQVQNYTNGDQTYLNGSNTVTTNSAVNIRNPYVSFNFIIKAET
jgi:microcystin-dependent protein